MTTQLASPAGASDSQFLHTCVMEQHANTSRLRIRARRALQCASTLCTETVLYRRIARAVAKQSQRLKLTTFYASVPDRLWLVPISGGGQVKNNSLHIKLDLFNDVGVLTALGEIDLTNHHLLGETLDQLDDALPLLLDLRGVDYLDSSGLHVLVRSCERHFTKHAPVAIIARPFVQRVCKVVGLNGRVTFFPDIAAALDHFGAGPR